ncbi:cysteine-rich receptor-like protein kinase 1 isoform X2 [Humulus lupulus]|uniref:cysteine-rich receptor-like protein kinase 1 isoform X2 n=1 Tax=Humulus lupulus TaxID=3486 RepID=UPI002B417D9B|nr:cysteine-rich receptor-like protein kinase 1 isoform X2 [Humulus lupulus]
MEFSISIYLYWIWVFLILNSLSNSCIYAKGRTNDAGRLCGSSEYTPLTNFIPNFIVAMDNVQIELSIKNWGASNISAPNPPVFAFAQCFGDLSAPDCRSCFAVARTKLPNCLPSVSARLYLDGCYLRYDNHSFIHETIDEKHDKISCGPPTDFSSDELMRSEFVRKVKEVLSILTAKAVNKGGYAVDEDRGGVEGVFGLAQCWKTLSKDECRNCLLNASAALLDCAPAAEGRAMFAGCYLRYSTDRFFHVEPQQEEENEVSPLRDLLASNRVWIVIAGIFSAIVLGLLALFGVYVGVYCGYRSKKNRVIHEDVSITIQKSNLNFKYEILERATEYFNMSRKLGQGGAGSVFKGILPDGKIVAVKRLFFNTRQWVDEFFNEVNLISGIEHKNLVKLLGCSIEGPESLLVYEFVPNKSLDQILYDKKNTYILSWQQRFDIIAGIAEGLAYLHGGCGLKIIHRDIKSSNILLGDDFIPKIADFGLARSVSADRTHLSTGIAGTLGYMAPEYLVRGQLTEKADVYAFGVLVLEIASGRKNSAFTLGSSSILHSVWKCYKEKKIFESVDPGLKSNFPIEEASNVLQIGLLCTQASVALRPSMSDVVKMLTDEEYGIPSPKQPPFLNASLLNADETRVVSDSPDLEEISSSFSANSSNLYESIVETTEASKPS